MASGEYHNSKNYTGLNVDNFLERASHSVTYDTSETFTNRAVVFSKINGEDIHCVSSNCGLTVSGFIQFKCSSTGDVKPIQQFYDGSGSMSIVLGGANNFSTPSSFTSWWTERGGDLLGATIKFNIANQSPAYSCTAVVSEQSSTKLTLSFYCAQKEYGLIMNYSSSTISYVCYQKTTVLEVDGMISSALASYLPLSAGSTKSLTGDLYFSSNKKIVADTSFGLTLGSGNTQITLDNTNGIKIVSKDNSGVGYAKFPTQDGSSTSSYYTIACREWVNTQMTSSLASYLSLSAGSEKSLTGDLYFAQNKKIIANTAFGISLGSDNSQINVDNQTGIRIITKNSSGMGYMRFPTNDGSASSSYYTVASQTWATNEISQQIATQAMQTISLVNMKQVLNALGAFLGIQCGDITKNNDGTLTFSLSDTTANTYIIRAKTPQS